MSETMALGILIRKFCPVCKKRLSTTAFNNSKGTVDNLSGTCRACTNSRRRQHENLGKIRRRSADNLASALRQGHIKIIRKLLNNGAKPHWSWVCETMREGHLAFAEELLESGIDRNVFTMAAMGDSDGVTHRIRRVPMDARLATSMEPNGHNVTPLHVGCASNWRSHGQNHMTAQVEVAKALRKHGADVNAHARYRGIDDATPLFCACWSSGNAILVQWLLDQGANATDRDLLAALGHFQRHNKGEYEIADALLAWGLSVDGNFPGNRTPLQAFAHQAAHKTVAWLIAHGAEVNARGPGDRTAAHFAAERNTGPTTLALLVESGADLAARDEDGQTPLDIARLNGKIRLIEWIERKIYANDQ